MPKRLYAYIFTEVFGAFTLAFIMFTFLMTLGMVFPLLAKGLGVMFVVQIMPYLLPSALPWTVPISILTACVVAYGRLSSDNETQAMSVVGVHPIHVVMPGVLLAVMLAVPMLYCNHFVEPQLHEKRRIASKEHLLERPFSIAAFDEPALDVGGAKIYVGSVDGFHLRDVMIHQAVAARNDDGTITHEIRVTYAAEGIYEIIGEGEGSELNLTLYGVTFKFVNPSEPFGYNSMQAEATALNFPLGDKAFRPGWKDMTTPELIREARRFTGPDAEYIRPDRLNDLLTRLRLRWSQAINGIGMAILGVALGMITRKGRKLIGFGLSVLVAVAVYFPLEVIGKEFSSNGVVGAPLWPFAGLIIISSIGFVLLWRVFKV